MRQLRLLFVAAAFVAVSSPVMLEVQAASAPAAPAPSPGVAATMSTERRAFISEIGAGHYLAAIDRLDRDGHWLKAATQIDPLTIDQTTVSEISRSPDERRLYDIVAPRVGNKPVIFFHAGEPVKIGMLGRGTGLQVVHPRLKTVNGRPTWLLTMGVTR